MGVRALSSKSVTLPVGGVWALVVSVTDSCGAPAAVVPDVAVTGPGDVPVAPTAIEVTTGVYRVELVLSVVGRYVARVTTPADGALDFVAYVDEVVADSGLPTVADVGVYLGEHSWSDDELQDALTAEAVAQRRVCSVPAAYCADLRQALLRRVQVNLAKRGQPFLTVPDSETPALIPARDAEVRRLEAPYRPLVMG